MGCEKISDSSVRLVINLSIFIIRTLVLEWISNQFQNIDAMFDGEMCGFGWFIDLSRCTVIGRKDCMSLF